MTRIGLVLGGGGATGGAFHAGVIAALVDAGFDPLAAEVMVGTSAGSIAATQLRCGYEAMDLYRRAVGEPLSATAQELQKRVPKEVRDDPEFGSAPRGPAAPELLSAYWAKPKMWSIGKFAAAALPAGKNSTSSISRAVESITRNVWPDKALWITAMRLTDGQLAVFGKDAEGPLGDAVAASCAIPAYFRPVEINGIAHVDGGMISGCNLDQVAGMGLDVVIVSAPMSIQAAVGKTLDLPVRQYMRRQLEKEASKVRAAGTRVISFAPTSEDLPVMGINPMAPGRESAVAKQARESVARRLRAEGLLKEIV